MANPSDINILDQRLREIRDALSGVTGGADGSSGTQVLSGSSAPGQSTGNIGDYYIETGSNPPNLYGPKTLGGWGDPIPLGTTAPQAQKALTLEAPGSSEDTTFFYAANAITISAIHAVVRGTSPSVTWTIRHGADRSATGNEVVTSGTTTTSQSGVTITSFNDATIPAGSWVWLETTAASGTVNELSVTIDFAED